MNLGGAIRDVRKLRGLTQVELSEKTGISQGSISQIEHGGKRPNKKNMATISKVLRTAEGFLYLLSIEKKDIPKSRHTTYDSLFPVIKEMIYAVTGIKP